MGRNRVRAWFGLGLFFSVSFLVATGCGPAGNEPLRTAPGTDTRSPQEKETDLMLQKSHQDYNKRFR
jgi:hypothetical protein